MMALTIRQPWAWLIVNGGKDIENRNWPTQFRGPMLVHAAKTMTLGEYNDAYWYAKDRGVIIPHQDKLELGGIVGMVDIIDCVKKSDSPWFIGRFGFVLRNPEPLPFVSCKGVLGFWKYSPTTRKEY